MAAYIWHDICGSFLIWKRQNFKAGRYCQISLYLKDISRKFWLEDIIIRWNYHLQSISTDDAQNVSNRFTFHSIQQFKFAQKPSKTDTNPNNQNDMPKRQIHVTKQHRILKMFQKIDWQQNKGINMTLDDLSPCKNITWLHGTSNLDKIINIWKQQQKQNMKCKLQ
jgi:hypothetical protein